MKSLSTLIVKVLNIDIVKFQDGTEFVKIQGIIPMSDKKKESVLSGEFETFELFDKWCDAYEPVCHKARSIETITLTGYYDKYKFKPVSLVEYSEKKDK